jgi:heme/copper-type cytochrome/quinol oxidase subunit 2
MQQALGLSGDTAIMFAIMVALGVAGIAALFMALFWPKRWRVSYRLEVLFALILVALGVYADLNSGDTYALYEKDIPKLEIGGTADVDADPGGFDRVVTVYAYQWGFLFLGPDGAGSRNAMVAKPNERILFHILSNDVIHGFNIPAVRFITEVDPGGVRSVWIRAPETPGKYLIQCIDYCGVGHHQMKAWLVVEGDGQADDNDDDHAQG